jgi:hypothetical protein
MMDLMGSKLFQGKQYLPCLVEEDQFFAVLLQLEGAAIFEQLSYLSVIFGTGPTGGDPHRGDIKGSILADSVGGSLVVAEFDIQLFLCEENGPLLFGVSFIQEELFSCQGVQWSSGGHWLNRAVIWLGWLSSAIVWLSSVAGRLSSSGISGFNIAFGWLG